MTHVFPITSRQAFALLELTGAIAGLMLLSAVVVAAISGARQRSAVEAASARLEIGQNVLARWRAGEPVVAPGWTIDVQAAAPGVEVLVLRAPGVTLATVRPLLSEEKAKTQAKTETTP